MHFFKILIDLFFIFLWVFCQQITGCVLKVQVLRLQNYFITPLVQERKKKKQQKTKPPRCKLRFDLLLIHEKGFFLRLLNIFYIIIISWD